VIRRIRGPAIVFDPVRRGIGESLRSADDRRRKSPRRTGCGSARPLSGVMALLGEESDNARWGTPHLVFRSRASKLRCIH